MKTILCVDDIRTNLYVLEALFETYYGDKYEIITVTSGEEALSILISHKVDLILLDVMMPELDGYETATLIQGNRQTKDIPIIFLTAKKDQEAISNCYKVGGVDYISKPYNEKELFARIDFRFKFQDSQNVINENRKLVDNILNMLDDMALVTNGANIVNVNDKLLEFYNISSIKKFIKNNRCISGDFIKYENYFSLSDVKEGELWTDVVIEKLKTQECKVLMNDTQQSEQKHFSINVKKSGSNYIVSFISIL